MHRRESRTSQNRREFTARRLTARPATTLARSARGEALIALTNNLMAAGGSQPTSAVCRFPQRHDPKDGPSSPRPGCWGHRFQCHKAGKNHMKLTTIVLASVLTITSSMAFAQGADGAGAGGTSGATGSSSVGSSTGTETTGISNATKGSSIGLSSGFSTGTYPTLTTPGGLPSSVPAPGAIISR
jgi:hypothetical protein